MALDPRTVVVPDGHVLHLYGRDGTHRVRGRNVETLHRRLEPYLHGTHRVEELAAAVPASHAAAVRSLLDGLRASGALIEVAPGTAGDDWEEPLGRLTAAGGWFTVELGGRAVRLSLDGGADSLPEGDQPLLAVLAPDRAARWLLGIGATPSAGRRWTCIVVAPEPDRGAFAAELHRRADCARWLLATSFDPAPDAARRLLFRLAGDGSISPLVRLRGDQAGEELHGSVVDQLGLVSAADVDQLPLVVATAAHDLFRGVATRYGCGEAEVRAAVVRDLLLRDRSRAAGTMVTGASKAEVELALIERTVHRRGPSPDGEGRRVDLLSPPADNPDVAYLQRVLRLRRRSVPALRAVGPEGIVSLRQLDGPLRATSVLPAKATADLLLAMVWREFYAGTALPGSPAPVCEHRGFAGAAELESRARELRPIAFGGRRAAPEIRRFDLWGVEAWRGRLPADRVEPRWR